MSEAENPENPQPAEPEAAGDSGTKENGATPVDLAVAKAAADAIPGKTGEGPVESADGAEAKDEPDELELSYGEVADLKDKLLRAMAETENLRRRGERDKTELRKYAIADFARDMLAVSDNLQRALSAVGETARKDSPELTQLLEGVELTRRELLGHFEKHGITEISPLGEKLDPNLHQAVVQIDDPEAPQGTVVQVMQPGYMIRDRLLRAAMVGVAKGSPAPAKVVEEASAEASTEPTAQSNGEPDGPAEPSAPNKGHKIDT